MSHDGMNLARAIALLTTLTLTPAASAQLIPDATLGDESSVVTPDVPLNGIPVDLIEGGAERGSNLFHSFTELSIDAAQRVYFANPVGIENILSRVTGGDPSNIFGTLGVAGPADLFLLNPNGIVFGPTASLDVTGSFYATTATAIALGEEGFFSATAPEDSPLLTVDPSIVFTNYLNDDSGDITSEAQLVTPEDLVLAANNLDLQGQIAVGGDLTLLSTDTVQIRDGVETPFIAFASGDLIVQGNEQVDIVALSNPDSGLYSYGDMVLRSASPIGGDAYYWSAGNFQTETLEGDRGDFFSPIDPIIRALGNVTVGTYIGSSLHILAGGSVAVDAAVVFAPEADVVGVDFLQEAVPLSNGEVFPIDGGVIPTLDIRAGVSADFLGPPPIPVLTGFDPGLDFFSVAPTVTPEPTRADINIGTVENPGGTVLLTNHYEPNLALTGDITVDEIQTVEAAPIFFLPGLSFAGDIAIDSRGTFTLTNNGALNAAAPVPIESLLFGTPGNGGNITILSQDDINFTVGSVAVTSGNIGGEILLNSDQGNVILEDSFILSSSLELAEASSLQTGNILIEGNSVFVDNFSSIITAAVNGDVTGGDIQIEAQETTRIRNDQEISEAPPSNIFVVDLIRSSVSGTGIATVTLGSADSGTINLRSDVLEIRNANAPTNPNNSAISEVPLSSLTGISSTTPDLLDGTGLPVLIDSSGNAGDINISANTIDIQGNQPGVWTPPSEIERARQTIAIPTGITSASQGSGRGGAIRIQTDEISIRDGSAITSGTLAFVDMPGNDGGDLQIEAEQSIRLQGKTAIATSTLGSGNAGSVSLLVTPTGEGISLSGGAVVSADTLVEPGGSPPPDDEVRAGNAGNVQVTTPTLRLDTNSRLGVSSGPRGGTAGNILIDTEVLEVVDSLISASTEDSRAGNIQVSASDSVSLSGTAPTERVGGLNVEVLQGGEAGSLVLATPQLVVMNNARVSVENLTAGQSGDIVLRPLPNQDSLRITLMDGSISGNTSTTGPGGQLLLQAPNAIDISGNGRLSVETGGTGPAGSIDFETQQLTLRDGTIVSASTRGAGRAGDITLAVSDQITIDDATVEATTSADSVGTGGNIIINTQETIVRNQGRIRVDAQGSGNGGDIRLQSSSLTLENEAQLTAQNTGEGVAGNIFLTILNQLRSFDSTIATTSESSSGGSVVVDAGQILLFGDSDIQTFVNSGIGGGGSINLTADIILAFSDSDILAFSVDGLGGDITLDTPIFFGERYVPGSPPPFENNNRVDINATGRIASGRISVPDLSFIADSLNELSSDLVNTEGLTAGSCIARSDVTEGSFVVTGSEGLPQQPDGAAVSTYATGTIRTASEAMTEHNFQEPQGVFQLSDGRLVLAQECRSRETLLF